MMKRFAYLFLSALVLSSCGEDGVVNTIPEPAPIPTPTPDPQPDPTPVPDDKPTAKQACWPENYGGVMLQGFYWDSYTDTQWSYLETQADDIAPYFSLIWVPNSGNCGGGNNMGYLPLYYFDQTSSFGSEAQLRSMISTYKKKGTGFIADVVINHHNTEDWFGFPSETYKGTNYQFKSTDICKNDDSGKAATAASTAGVKLSDNNDTGEDWDGTRDLDHKSENTQKIVNAYLDFLLNDLGYTGFRYDMVKGYSASFAGLYNAKAAPKFSVGEYWEGSVSKVQNWIEGTKVSDFIQSAAFDFPFRYTCRDAVNGQQSSTMGKSRWGYLLNNSLATDKTYNRFAVTFVENHDTEYRSAQAEQDPIRRDTLAVNAWLLANPGTPCVFYKHWQAYKKDIKLMIEARKLVGIHNQSEVANKSKSTDTFAARQVWGKNGSLIVVVGADCNNFAAPEGFTELLTGYHYRYLVDSKCDQSTWAATVARIAEEEHTEPFTPHTATIYVKSDFTPVYFYVWDSNNNTQLNGDWPGKAITDQVEINGEKWYTQKFDIKTEGYYFNIIFNQGKDKPQTTDIGHVDSDKYYEITIKDGKVEYKDVSSSMM